MKNIRMQDVSDQELMNVEGGVAVPLALAVFTAVVLVGGVALLAKGLHESNKSLERDCRR